MPIYNNNRFSNNQTELYKKLLEERGIKNIYQFRTKIFENIDLSSIQYSKYIWKKDDNLFKLANKFYNNKDYWWIIGYVNSKPTDAHFEIGDEILIPPIEILRKL